MDIVRHVLPPEQGETKWLTSLNAFEAQETVRQAQFKRKRWPELPDGIRVAGGVSHSYPHILPDGDGQIEKALFAVDELTGFIIACAVYLFNWKKYRPIVRPAILTAFLGYLMAVVALFFDIGHPFRYGVTE